MVQLGWEGCDEVQLCADAGAAKRTRAAVRVMMDMGPECLALMVRRTSRVVPSHDPKWPPSRVPDTDVTSFPELAIRRDRCPVQSHVVKSSGCTQRLSWPRAAGPPGTCASQKPCERPSSNRASSPHYNPAPGAPVRTAPLAGGVPEAFIACQQLPWTADTERRGRALALSRADLRRSPEPTGQLDL